MKIEILEETGIKTSEYGHMKHGEIRVVEDGDGEFYCANGWAKDVDGQVETGKRGKLDRVDPKKWAADKKAEKADKVQPQNVVHPSQN